ncbi:MAG: DbpA RNA binding domain-containing protein, partial [Novosphingobium sp.]
ELIEIGTAGAEGEGGAAPPHHRPGFDDVVWFRMDIGRRQNADPRWLLPLLCRRGHITRGEIGAIRIAANETHFQVPRAVEAKFRAALARTARPGDDGEAAIAIEPSPGPPSAPGRKRGSNADTARKPHRKGGPTPAR